MTDSVYTRHQPAGSNDLYLRLKDGDKVKLRIVSEPVITVYKEGDRPRYAWIVFNREAGKAQVYASGVSVYSQIRDLAEDWGSPNTYDITIKRTGSGVNDTEYSVNPVKESEDLTKDQQDEAAKIDLPQATKGKWLSDYLDDQKLPDPISSEIADTAEPMPRDEDAPIDPSEIPF